MAVWLLPPLQAFSPCDPTPSVKFLEDAAACTQYACSHRDGPAGAGQPVLASWEPTSHGLGTALLPCLPPGDTS